MDRERIIQGFVLGKQVILAHFIVYSDEELTRRIDVPDADVVGIMTLTPEETTMIAGDLVLKVADVHIGFLDHFSDALAIYGSVGAVKEALSQTVSGLGRLLNYALCEMTKGQYKAFMERVASVGTVGAGKTTLFNTSQGDYTLARKAQAVELNGNGGTDMPGEYFGHPRWYYALVTTLQDVDMLIYVHDANDPESQLLVGLLDIGINKRQTIVTSRTDMLDADVAVTRKLSFETGFGESILKLNSHGP